MGKSRLLASFLSLLLLLPSCVLGDSPYRFFTWNVTYGDIYPLGVKQQVCSSFLSCFFLLWSRWPSLETERDCSSLLVEPTQGILINGQFPGPQIEAVTNDNLIVNVFNSLPEPFLFSWLLLSAISPLPCFIMTHHIFRVSLSHVWLIGLTGDACSTIYQIISCFFESDRTLLW